MNYDTIKLSVLQLVYDHQSFYDEHESYVDKVITDAKKIMEEFFPMPTDTLDNVPF